MREKKTFKITREKHMDHMVKVVPFIAFIYAAQSYLLWNLDGPINSTSLLVLGCLLGTMIGLFLLYDLKHSCELYDQHLEIYFLGRKKTIFFQDILEIHITDPAEAFGSVILKCKQGRTKLYFVDDIEKVKDWITSHQSFTLDNVA
jgi:hypothetical protein